MALTKRQKEVQQTKHMFKRVDDNIKEMSDTQLKDRIRQLAKTSNQRLRQLEKDGLAESSVSYKAIQRLHFDKEQYPFMTETGKGEIKFRTALTGVSREQLEVELSALRDFLGRRSSTSTGVRALHEANWRKYNEKMEAEGKKAVSFQAFSETYKDALIKKFIEQYGSDEVHKIIEMSPKDMTADDIDRIFEETGVKAYLNGEDVEKPTLDEIHEAFRNFAKKDPQKKEETNKKNPTEKKGL